jgi:hypothetical protein
VAQRVVIALMAIGAAVAVVAALVLVRPPAPFISGAPLDNPAITSLAPSSPSTSSVPATVRLIVPSQNIDIPVIEGDGLHVPLKLAMHYPNTAQPGAGSNSLFYAHGQ